MKPPGQQLLIEQLRNVVLLDADFLNAHAQLLEERSRTGVARPVLEKQLRSAAIAVRARAAILHDVLVASEPKAETGAQ